MIANSSSRVESQGAVGGRAGDEISWIRDVTAAAADARQLDSDDVRNQPSYHGAGRSNVSQ